MSDHVDLGRRFYDQHADHLVVHVEDEHLGADRAYVYLEHWLTDDSGTFGDYGIRLSRQAAHDLGWMLVTAATRLQLPTEGGADDDMTDQGCSGGETAAETGRAGADSREVGAVMSEASPEPEEGAAGEPSTGGPPERRCDYVIPLTEVRCRRPAEPDFDSCGHHVDRLPPPPNPGQAASYVHRSFVQRLPLPGRSL